MIAAKGTKIYTKNGPQGTLLSPHPQKIKNPLSPQPVSLWANLLPSLAVKTKAQKSKELSTCLISITLSL